MVGTQNTEQTYRSRLLTEYIDALKELGSYPPTALDFIAAKAEHVVSLKVAMTRAGLKPVCHGGWWEIIPIGQAPKEY